MEDYKKMYMLMFNRVTDALNALNNFNYGQAADILRTAQSDAEELYIDGSGDI